MSERRSAGLRLLVAVLLVANVLFFIYWHIARESRSAALSRIEELQINPTRIKILRVATRGPGGHTPKEACLEWGPIAAGDVGRADAELARLGLPQEPLQRTLSESEGERRVAYYVREPTPAIVGRMAELQRSFPGTEIKAGACPS